MDEANKQYHIMTETPVGPLIVRLSIPTTISMLITNIYNTVDTYFVSSISTSAAGAVGIVFGLMAVLQAFGFMFGHGAGSHISRALGERDRHKARVYAATSFYASVIIGVVIGLMGIVLMKPFMYLLGSTDTIYPYAKTYAFFILLGAPAMTSSCVMNNILRYEGRASAAMIGLTLGSVLNILGDYLLMRIMHLGMVGAGLSTCLTQYISAFVLLYMFKGDQTQSKFYLRDVSFSTVLLGVMMVGFPSLCRQGLNSIAAMVLNTQAKIFGGDAAIAAMSIVGRINMLIFSVCIGIGQGLQPVAAFNYGAMKFQRLREAVMFTLKFSLAVLVILSGIGFVFAHPAVALFRNETAVLAIGVPALRYQCIALCFMPINTCINMLYQSIGKGGIATFLATLRNGFGFIPLAFILPSFLGLTGLELAQPIADLMCCILAIPFLVYFLRKYPPTDAM